jgi:threonine aldolase
MGAVMWIDLRSDTVTRPSPGMREAMARAEVGDDVFGEDPSVNRLEARVAEMMGKEAALFVPSGTMSNQLAVKGHTEPGDEVILERGAHIANNESGAPAVLSGVNLQLIDGERGVLPVAAVERAIRATTMHTPGTALVCVENTHNRAGGAIYPIDALRAVSAAARAGGVRVHLDGARLMNAVVATGVPVRAWADCADTVSLCISKGLGAPVGSVLSGADAVIRRARRFRKMWGGGMRQAGVLAAACHYALDHNVERLAEDHAKAKRLAEGLAGCRGVDVDPWRVETNIVVFRVPDPSRAATIADAMRAEKVLFLPVGPGRFRLVAHLDVSLDAIGAAVVAFERVLGRAA